MSKFKLLTVACTLILTLLPSAWAGGESSAGGHGVLLPDGSQVLLDRYRYRPELVCPEARDFLPRESDLATVHTADQKIRERILSLESRYPALSGRLNRLWVEGMKWKLCPSALPLVNDANFQGAIQGRLFQGAIQLPGFVVIVDQERLLAGDNQYVQDLMVHELLLAYTGYGIDRERLRSMVRAFNEPQGVNLDYLSYALPRNDGTLHFTIKAWEDGEDRALGAYGFLIHSCEHEPILSIEKLHSWFGSPYVAETSGTPPKLICARVAYAPMRPLFTREGTPASPRLIHYVVYMNGVTIAQGEILSTRYELMTPRDSLQIWLP